MLCQSVYIFMMVLEEIQSLFTSVLLDGHFCHKIDLSLYWNHTQF